MPELHPGQVAKLDSPFLPNAQAVASRADDHATSDEAMLPSKLYGRSATAVKPILALQGSAGNSAVQRLLSKGAVAKLSPRSQQSATTAQATAVPIVGPAMVQRAPKRGDQTANLARLTTLRANADARFTLATNYANESLAVGDLVHDKLSAISGTYATAYDRFRKVLNTAQQEAQNQQQWTDIIVGVIAGAAAGLAAAFVLPSTAAGWFSLTLAEAATAAASSTGQGVVSGGLALAASGLTAVSGKNISSEGLQPAFQELAMWKKVSEIYRSGLEVTPVTQASHNLSSALADRIADVRVYAAGGKSELSDARITEMITTLERQDAGLTTAREELALKIVHLSDLRMTAAGIDTSKPVDQMEKDIWRMWMSSLAPNSNILDIDAIENHIGPKGLRIVDFGIYTTDADENEAIENARNNVAQMRAAAAQTDVPSNPGGSLRIRTLNP